MLKKYNTWKEGNGSSMTSNVTTSKDGGSKDSSNITCGMDTVENFEYFLMDTFLAVQFFWRRKLRWGVIFHRKSASDWPRDLTSGTRVGKWQEVGNKLPINLPWKWFFPSWKQSLRMKQIKVVWAVVELTFIVGFLKVWFLFVFIFYFSCISDEKQAVKIVEIFRDGYGGWSVRIISGLSCNSKEGKAFQ